MASLTTIPSRLQALRPTPPALLWLAWVIAVACQPSRPSAPASTAASASTPSSFAPWHQRLDRGKWVEPTRYVATTPGSGRFRLSGEGQAATLVVSGADHRGVIRATDDLRIDIERVTGIKPLVVDDAVPTTGSEYVMIGTLGKSPLLNQLVAAGKLDVSDLTGRWEKFLIQVVEHPSPKIARALVIAGSDHRGTIYGIYDLCAQMGVSPWHFWADVPVQQKSAVYVLPGPHTAGEPAVKYRGFFINDENPALGTWAPKFFGPGHAPNYPGGFNRHFYAKIFELMLRLKANYLWPAVWGRAFAEDDPANQATADEYGVIMGTSHEAPMNRGIEEWNRHAVAAIRDAQGNITKPGADAYGGTGEWSFRRNAGAVKAYWTEGIRRMGNSELIVTLGMRGNGDTALEDGAGIELMETIVSTERQILAEVTGKELHTIPQVWTLYKEVQDYWDRGMRAPDDVTIVWCDDNWGNLRKLPDPSLSMRRGGHGLYYHFDYVGGSRNYKWVDTNLVPNIWEQLHLAYRYGVEQLWMVNVGDVKGVELPLEFFLDYAWSPERWTLDRLPEWQRRWAAQQFDSELAAPIAELMHRYSQLQARRKPELLNRRITLDPTQDLATDPDHAVVYDDAASPYSLTDYREFERVVEEWQSLAREAERVQRDLPARSRDAYFQLAHYPIKASALLYELRLFEFTNLLYHSQGRSATNEMADAAELRFEQSRELADYYNHTLANGKWNGFQTQPYIGYGDVARYGATASWQQPEKDNQVLPDAIYPPLKRYTSQAGLAIGVAIDGSDKVWPAERSRAVLPQFSPFQRQPSQYLEVFSAGTHPFEYRISPGAPYISVVPSHGRLGGNGPKQIRATVSVDWSRAPKGSTRVPIEVSGPNGFKVTIDAVVSHPESSATELRGFVESNGYVSIEADHYTKAVATPPIHWQRIADIGRTGSGVTPFPVTASRQVPGGENPHLEYDLHLFTTGPVEVWAFHSPRNNVLRADGIRYAVSLDDGPPEVVNLTQATGAEPMNRSWERNTADNVTRTLTRHHVQSAGHHVLKYWMVDPTTVLQKLVIDTGGLKPSYLGPPESSFYGPRGVTAPSTVQRAP